MAANTRYAAAISALSVLSAVSAGSFPGYPSCIPTTTTVYTTITVPDGSRPSAVKQSPAPAATTAQQYGPNPVWDVEGVTWPTYSPDYPNPNGPYYNPHNYLPDPAPWPGKPVDGAEYPPPFPPQPYPTGGYDADKYDGPHWCEKGSDLTPALPQKDTNGDSYWGLPDCPHLPPYVGPSGSASVKPTLTSASSSSKSTKGSSAGAGPSLSGGPSLSAGPTSRGPFSSFSVPHNGSSSSSTSSGPLSFPSSFSTSSSFSSSSVKSNSSFVSSITSSFSDTCVADDTSPACGATPDTGVTRHYHFDITYGVIAPDGVKRNAILINGGFPGPLIEANWGDWIEVSVKNSLPESPAHEGEPTAMHWHGLLQHETPFADGVPSVQQCPIAPGKSHTYRFRADQFGTSWYHSHYSAQYAGGAVGPIVIHGPATACYDEDLGPIMLSDWYHSDYYTNLKNVMNNQSPPSQNALINGKMNYPCASTTLECTPNAGVSKFKFTPGKKYRLRLINTSAEAFMKFTLDGHSFTVFANDFKPVVPYTTTFINLAVGQRSDVIVEATQAAGTSFWMRAEMGNARASDGCTPTDGISTEAVAAVYYDGADINSVPTTVTGLTQAQKRQCGNDILTRTAALCPVPLAPESEVQTINLDFDYKSNGTHFVWMVNDSSFRANMNKALLAEVIDGNLIFEPSSNVIALDPTKTAIRVVMRNLFTQAHPMHLHGHDFNILASGFGTWNGTITNPERTVVRDVVGMPPFGGPQALPSYAVIQFNQDSPGVWPFHCHIAWHVSQGLYVNFLEKPLSIDYPVPGSIRKTCADYNAWSDLHVPNQIDSGL